MTPRPKVLAKAATALACLATASCVSYSRYEATAHAMDKYKALAASRRDSIEVMRWAHLQTYRENDELAHRTRLLDTELSSTRTQYAQLQVANADVVNRYDRSLALSSMENEAQYSARRRLTNTALASEADAAQAVRARDEMDEALEDLQTDLEDYRDELDATRAEVRRFRSAPPSERTPVRRPDTPSPPPQAIESLGALLDLGELDDLGAYGSSLASVSDEGHQYVIRASESMCFGERLFGLKPAGKAFLGDLAGVLYGRDRLELLVHPVSKREGMPAQLNAIERKQSSLVVDELARRGIHPDNVRSLDDAQWNNRVTEAGALGSNYDGEVVFVIRPRATGGMSMR